MVSSGLVAISVDIFGGNGKAREQMYAVHVEHGPLQRRICCDSIVTQLNYTPEVQGVTMDICIHSVCIGKRDFFENQLAQIGRRNMVGSIHHTALVWWTLTRPLACDILGV